MREASVRGRLFDSTDLAWSFTTSDHQVQLQWCATLLCIGPKVQMGPLFRMVQRDVG